MREQLIAFARYQRQSAFCHVVEHIAKQSEIKVRGGEGDVAQAGDDRDHRAGEQTRNDGDDHDRAFSRLPFLQQFFVGMYGIKYEQTEHDGNGESEKHRLLGYVVRCQPIKDANAGEEKQKPRIGLKSAQPKRNGGEQQKDACRRQYHGEKRGVLRIGEIGKWTAE